MSLIGLMVGLLLSVLGVLAGLTLYRDMVQVTAMSTYDSSFDGQMAALMLQIQLELQDAGYGLDNSLNKPLDVFTGIEDGKGIQSIYWRFSEEAGTVICRGIEERTESDGSVDTRVITLVEADAGCSENVALDGPAFAPVTELARFMVRDTVQAYLTANAATGTLLTFSKANVTCAPFGAGTPGKHVAAIVTAPTATFLNNLASGPSAGVAGVNVETLTLCLPNTTW